MAVPGFMKNAATQRAMKEQAPFRGPEALAPDGRAVAWRGVTGRF